MINPGPEKADQPILPDQVPAFNRFDWLTLGQFSFSLLAGLLLIGSCLVSSLVLALGRSDAIPAVSEVQLLSSYLFSAALGFAGILMIPSVLFSGRRLFGRPDQGRSSLRGIRWVLLLLPALVLLGYLIQTGPAWSKPLLPLIHVIANGAGIFWFLELVHRKLPEQSQQRFWGVFSSGLALVPAIAFTIEILILVGIGLIWMVIIQTQPAMKQDLLSLLNRLQQSNATPLIFEGAVGRVISQPGVALTIFLYIAVLIPLVEELFKPMVIWFVLGRKLQPLEGFLIGATAGAGYALFENLTIGATADIWTFVMITRLGTTAIHMMTSGLVGWGLASAWTDKRYLRLAGAYLGAVILHGIWNGLNVLSALADFPVIQDSLGSFGTNFANYAPVGLVILALGCFGGLLRANLYFRRAIMTPVS